MRKKPQSGYSLVLVFFALLLLSSLAATLSLSTEHLRANFESKLINNIANTIKLLNVAISLDPSIQDMPVGDITEVIRAATGKQPAHKIVALETFAESNDLNVRSYEIRSHDGSILDTTFDELGLREAIKRNEIKLKQLASRIRTQVYVSRISLQCPPEIATCGPDVLYEGHVPEDAEINYIQALCSGDCPDCILQCNDDGTTQANTHEFLSDMPDYFNYQITSASQNIIVKAQLNSLLTLTRHVAPQ